MNEDKNKAVSKQESKTKLSKALLMNIKRRKAVLKPDNADKSKYNQ